MGKLPIYAVDSPRLFAGAYPIWILDELVAFGIRSFVDLTEPHEIEARKGRASYGADLDRLAARHGLELALHRIPIEDFGIPDDGTLVRALECIDRELAEQRPVYVHCWGGYGRTGIVVGAWLIRHGLATADSFEAEIAERRAELPNHFPSPVTLEQVEYVRAASRWVPTAS